MSNINDAINVIWRYYLQTKYNKQPQMAGLGTQEREIIDYFVSNEKVTVGADELVDAFPMSRQAANQILSRLRRKGWLQRMKRGVYVTVPLGSSSPEPVVEDAWPLAMSLYSPCFISGWSAAEYWDFTEQIFNAVAVVTSSPQRRQKQTHGSVTFYTRVVKPERMFGSKRIWQGSQRIEIADPHRLAIDVMDSPKFGGGGRHAFDVVKAYWKSEHANPERLLEYAERYGRGTVFKRLGFIAEKFGNVSDNWLEACRQQITAGISNFDPGGTNKGVIKTRWNLRINIPIEKP